MQVFFSYLLALSDFFIDHFPTLLPLLVDLIDLNILLEHRILLELMLELLSEFVFFLHAGFHFF